MICRSLGLNRNERLTVAIDFFDPLRATAVISTSTVNTRLSHRHKISSAAHNTDSTQRHTTGDRRGVWPAALLQTGLWSNTETLPPGWII